MENAPMFSGWYGEVYAVDCGGPERLVVVRFFEEGGELVRMGEDQVTRIWISAEGWERLFAAWQQWKQEYRLDLEDSQPF